jgi:hypothetical protein
MTDTMHMRPASVREVGRKLERFWEELGDVVSKVVQGAEGMDWSSAERDDFISDIRTWEGNVFPTQVTCDVLRKKINNEVEAWESAAAKFGWGSKGYTPFLVGTDDATAVDLNDVDQGGLGDCYLMASLATISQQHPELIEQMIHDNGDGTFTVTFYEKKCESETGPCSYEKVSITVDMDFPTGGHDGYAYGEPGDTTRRNKEVWPMIIERAYAEWKGGYENIDGGSASLALSELTGMDSTVLPPAEMDISELYDAYQRGDALVANSLPDYRYYIDGKWFDIQDISDDMPEYQNRTIINDHSYAITNVDPANNTVTLTNPWNDGCKPLVLTYEDYQRLFAFTIINPVQG